MLERIKERLGRFGSTAQWVLWALIMALSVLPLIKTVNEFMTILVLKTQTSMLIERLVVPPMARMIGAILRYVFGAETMVNGGSIFLITRGLPYELYISWNCVGWQSLVLLLFSLSTGLQGSHSLRSKLKCVALGLEGIVAVNLLRIVTSAMLLLRWGYDPAITFHNNLSLILTYTWLGAFWYISNGFILEPSDEAENRPIAERMRGSLGNLRLRSLLPDFIYGRRAMGLATMVIILTVTALSGIAVLSAKVHDDGDWTILTFEHIEPAVVFNGMNTSRILTLPSYTNLGSTYTDSWTAPEKKTWFEVWNFSLYGPLDEDYTITGHIVFTMYFYADEEGEVNIRFTIYDVDENGASTYVAHYEEEKELEDESPDEPLEYVTEYIDPYTFSAGHTIRIRIDIRTSNPGTTYYFDYDSSTKHSYIDLPGIVVSENVTHLIYLALVIPPLTATLRKRKRHGRTMAEQDGSTLKRLILSIAANGILPSVLSRFNQSMTPPAMRQRSRAPPDHHTKEELNYE